MRTKIRVKRHRFWTFEPLETRQVLSTLFVSPTGSDSGTGTAAAPYKTLQKAANVAVAGDIVDVASGKYAGFVMGWDTPKSGLPGKPITFIGEPGAIINTKNPKTRDGIDIEGGSWITIQGFTVTGMGRAGIRSTGGDHVVIQNNIADGNSRWGIFTSFDTNVLIQNNVASHSTKEHGIYVSNSAVNPTVANNVVFGNRGCGIHMNGDASQGGTGIITGASITGNVIFDNGVHGGSAINLDGVRNSVISNNLLYNNHHSGISLFQEDSSGPSTNDTVTNNTVIMAANSKWGSALNLQNGSINTNVSNNILVNTNPRWLVSLQASADSLPGLVSDNNALMAMESADGGNSMISLAKWRGLAGNDIHSVPTTTATIGFTDVSNDNYQLTSNSPAAGLGATVSLAKDPSGALSVRITMNSSLSRDRATSSPAAR